MSEQRFEVFQECEYLEEWSSCPYCIKYDGETVFETLPLGIAKEVCKKLNEQQATIRRLQDLCGKSDYENAKLREEVNLLRPTNIEQYEQIVQLQEENEKLKNRLNKDL